MFWYRELRSITVLVPHTGVSSVIQLDEIFENTTCSTEETTKNLEEMLPGYVWLCGYYCIPPWPQAPSTPIKQWVEEYVIASANLNRFENQTTLICYSMLKAIIIIIHIVQYPKQFSRNIYNPIASNGSSTDTTRW